MAAHRTRATCSRPSSTFSAATRSTRRRSRLPEAGRTDFERAVAAFPLDEVVLDAESLAVAHGSLEQTGLFVLGESHGIAETAGAILTLVRALGIRSLGLEWSFDEVGELVDEVVATGRFDLDALWAIPAGGDLFAADGRFTAGHVRVIEHLVQSGELSQIVAFDRLDQDPPLEDDREADMAERLLEQLQADAPMLAVTGFLHAARTPFDGLGPMFVHLERALPGLANGALEFSDGTAYSRGARPVKPIDRPFDAILSPGRATPATVPVRQA